MNSFRATVTGLACAVATGCSSDSPGGSVAPDLRDAPAELSVAGVTVRLEPYLWRDFQPISPPDGRPLIAVLRVKTVDGTAIPPELEAEAVTVINGQSAWVTPVGEEQPREAGASAFEVVAQDGPKWGPGIEVDVVVTLRDAAGRAYFLQARRQPIHRTD